MQGHGSIRLAPRTPQGVGDVSWLPALATAGSPAELCQCHFTVEMCSKSWPGTLFKPEQTYTTPSLCVDVTPL